MGCTVPRGLRPRGTGITRQRVCADAYQPMVGLETGVTNASADEGVAVMRKPAALLFVLSLAVVALALVPAAGLAAKGGNGGKPSGGGSTGGGSSISGPFMVTDTNTPGLSRGDKVTFDVSTTATTRPWVNVNCYQGGKFVYGEWHGFYPEYLYGQTYTLGPTRMWQSGGADCTAALVSKDGNHDRILTSIGFYVYP
jgi:hypothetical protein